MSTNCPYQMFLSAKSQNILLSRAHLTGLLTTIISRQIMKCWLMNNNKMLRHLEGQGQLLVAKACFKHKIKEHRILTIIRKVHCILLCLASNEWTQCFTKESRTLFIDVLLVYYRRREEEQETATIAYNRKTTIMPCRSYAPTSETRT